MHSGHGRRHEPLESNWYLESATVVSRAVVALVVGVVVVAISLPRWSTVKIAKPGLVWTFTLPTFLECLLGHLTEGTCRGCMFGGVYGYEAVKS